MIAVTFALRSESSEFIRRLESPRPTNTNAIRGTLASQEVAILHTGVGEKATRMRITEFLDKERPSVLISSGFAGGLSDNVRPGELLLAQNISDPILARAAGRPLERFGVRSGRLTTVSRVMHSVDDRAERAAADGAVAVDMETMFIAEACSAHAVPMLSLRVISDTPRAPFPAPPEVLFDIERQRTNYRSLLLHIVQHPRALRRIIAFGSQIADARRVLAEALFCLVSDGALSAPHS